LHKTPKCTAKWYDRQVQQTGTTDRYNRQVQQTDTADKLVG